MKQVSERLTSLAIAKTKLATIRGICQLAKKSSWVEHALTELILSVLDAGVSEKKPTQSREGEG